jgi:ornithine cyclodeaminase/alanine dehydrogenase-like protein (mu-crystallin family)
MYLAAMGLGKSTLILGADDVVRLLDVETCIAAVERAFRLFGCGKAARPGVLGLHARDGGFHIKAGTLETDAGEIVVAKINANFPQNPARHNLPAIQGVVALFDAVNGRLLALMDSIELTALRTAAATAVAARYLAREDAAVATIAGCGTQGRAQLRALAHVRPLRQAFAVDQDEAAAERFAGTMERELGFPVTPSHDLDAVAMQSHICITCTPATAPILHRRAVRPGTFVAGVGADSEYKWELAPDLLAAATLVVDVREQASTIGDLHHAIDAGVLTAEAVHADLGEVVAGRRPGRTSNEEITVFDSTGMALQDAAAAAAVYARARGELVDSRNRDGVQPNARRKAVVK